MKLYACRTSPCHWVAEDEEGRLQMFYAWAAGTWPERKAYRGHREALIEAPAYNAIGTGWPGYRGAEAP